jgi:thiamine-phosphate pyrophosphorylase
MNTDISLLDANLARAAEGLRVLDDSARFILRDQSLFLQLKRIRHALILIDEKIGQAQLLQSRQPQDVGRSSEDSTIESRNSLWSIIIANGNRVSEALRVLEEFGKIYVPDAVQTIASLRYEVYNLQCSLVKKTPHFWLRYYFEQGVVYPLSNSVDELIFLIQHGARVIQLRDKDNSSAGLFEKTKKLLSFISDFEAAKGIKIILMLNDDVEVAARLPVAGVHVGQQDKKISFTRLRLGSNKIVGRSNNSIEQIKQSVSDGADYVSLGPVFATPLKPDRQVVGLSAVSEAATFLNIPWVVIGGIDLENINSVRQAGAKNIAVIRSAREFFLKK